VNRIELEKCPSALGLPVVRRRFYALASREPLALPDPPRLHRPIGSHLGDDRPELRVPDEIVARFGDAFHRVDPADPQAEAACFTRAYGKSPVYAGSYLVRPGGVRYFAPEEIARLHGHRAGFSFADLTVSEAWKRVGNGLSVDVVRWLLEALPRPILGRAGL
jgi:site-specific DNA-cytosine methylase